MADSKRRVDSSGSGPRRRPNAYERLLRIGNNGARFVVATALFLFIGLLIQVLVEWAGMTWWWEDEGAGHARRVLETEIAYLDADFSRTILGTSPRALAERSVGWADGWLESNGSWFDWARPEIPVRDDGSLWVYLKQGYASVWLWFDNYVLDIKRSPSRYDSTFLSIGKSVYHGAAPYLSAAHDIMLVYVVRVLLIVLSLPLILFGIGAWFADGVVERERRKAGAGRESSLKFHWLEPWIGVGLLGPFIFYLSSPFPTHPVWALAPITALVGGLVYFTTANYQKYL